MRDDRSPAVDTSSWATILPGGAPPTRQEPLPAQPAHGAQAPLPQKPAPAPGPAPLTPPPACANPPAYGSPAFGGVPPTGGIAPHAVLSPPPAAFSPGTPNPAFLAMPLPFVPPKQTNRGLIIGVVVGAVVLVAALIAIAIPVVLAQQKPVPVTLTIPASLEGSPQITTSAAQQATSMIVQGLNESEHGLASNFNAALYAGGTSPGVLVAAGKLTRRPNTNERAQFFRGFEHAAAGSANPVQFAPVPPGPLGGTTECGLETAETLPAVMCLTVDNSATVFIAVYTSDLVEGTTTALRVRSEIEHR